MTGYTAEPRVAIEQWIFIKMNIVQMYTKIGKTHTMNDDSCDISSVEILIEV